MSWSIPIGTVRGTVIRLHITFLLFLLWIGLAHYSQGGAAAAVQGVLFMALLFLCVLLHEFGHIFAARRYGVQTPEVVLLPIGGV
ncbi:MAG: site-2 protease family protein, partial [Geminicoccaceae bacterium]